MPAVRPSTVSGSARRTVAVGSLLALMTACSSPEAPPAIASLRAPDAGFLNQWRPGRDEADLARTWYFTTQGSHLLDFDVFMSVARASDQTPFSARENLEPYGFLYPASYAALGGDQNDATESALPIGLVKDTRGEGYTPLAKHANDLTKDYLGLTCAACHTGDLRYNGERFLIHGGQGNLDYERFSADLVAAVSKTNQDPAGTGYLQRMAARGIDEAVATNRLAGAKQRMDDLHTRGQVPTGREAGPGRLDAVTHILNEVFGRQYGNPRDPTQPYNPDGRDLTSVVPPGVPISVPHVWNAARLQCVQTNCLTSNSLTRNVGEVLGVFGDSETYTDASGRRRARSTAKVKNLFALEEALDWVRSPKWSAKFTPIGANLAEGARAFATHCQGCHAQPYLDKFDAQWDSYGENWSGTNAPSDLADHFVAEEHLGKTRYVWRVTKVGYETVGTDDQFVKVHAGRYTTNARAVEILDGKVRDAVLATLRERAGNVVSKLAAQVAELEGRDTTLLGGGLVELGFRKARAEQSTRENPIRRTDGTVMTLILLAGTTASSVDSYFLDAFPDRKVAAAERDKYGFYRARPQPATLSQMAVYRARPLNGVAFTAPYGHNGVWPTLESVLFPETRPESFWVGHNEFDPVAAGVDIKKGEAACSAPDRPVNCFKIATTARRTGTDDSGNSRSGHAGATFYGGKEPTAEEKRAILEYLKSI